MNFDRLAELVDRAHPLTSPVEIEAFLSTHCGDDPEMRRQVEALLAVRQPAAGFLETTVQAAIPPLPHEKVGDRIDRYQLIQPLGEGGCGVVYLAEQREPVQRRVALKIIKPGLDSRAIAARFEGERQALARMEHPNVAKVYDAGITTNGRPYFVMELIHGTKITDYCDSSHLPVAARLDLFIKVCHAIQHAHQKGVVHRDIKPANVLVTVHDGTPEPKVIDFGIAKAIEGRLTDATVFTARELFLGTPAYMSPEQADQTSDDVDTRSDIYSLGVLLYELLTGYPPFESRDLMAAGLREMLRTIREKDPIRPSTRIRRSELPSPATSTLPRTQRSPLPADLDWIVMKCLEKDRSRRYATANEVAMDLQRHLANEPVLARPPTHLDRLYKVYRRNSATFASAVLVSVALLTGTIASTWQAGVANRASKMASLAELSAAREARLAKEQRDHAEEARTEANRNAEQARRFAYVANLNIAAHAWHDGNLSRVNDLLRAQIPQPGEEDLRDFEWRYLWEQSRSLASAHRRIGRTPTRRARFFMDGSRILTAHLDDVARVLDPTSLEPLATLTPHPIDLAVSSDGATLAILSNHEFVDLFDASSLERRRSIANLPATADLILLSPDGTHLAISEDRQIGFWDSRTGERVGSIPIRPRPLGIGAFTASPDWTLFLTTDNHSIYLWDRASHALVAELPGHPGGIFSAAFSPDGRWFATGGWQDRAIRLWDASSFQLSGIFTNHHGWIGGLDFSPDSSTLASGSADHTIRLWDLRNLRSKGLLKVPHDEVWMVHFSPDGRSLVSADRSGGVSVWRSEPQPIRPTYIHGDFTAGEFSADSRSFVTTTPECLVQSWDEGTLHQIRQDSLPTQGTALRRLGPRASRIAIAHTNGIIHLHEPSRHHPIQILRQPDSGAIVDLVFSHDESRLLSVTREDFRVWNLTTGTCIYHRTNLADAYWRLNPVAISPDGSQVAFGDTELQLRVIHCASGVERRIDPDLWGVIHLRFSPDGSKLAAAGRDHRIKIWRLSDLQELSTLKAWRQGARCFEFHPNGRRLVVGSGEGGVQWIDLATAQEVAHFPTGRSPSHLVFAPDGNTLAVHLGDGIRFWRAPSWSQIEIQDPPRREPSPLERGNGFPR